MITIFRKLRSERLNNRPTASQPENLKFDANSARLQSSCFEVLYPFVFFIFKKMCVSFHGLSNNFMVRDQSSDSRILEDTTLHREGLSCLSLRGHQEKVLGGAVTTSNGTCNASCVRGPEKPDSKVRTRIMAA